MWKQKVNLLLRRTIGYELTRPGRHELTRTGGQQPKGLPPPRGQRLLRAPVFIFSSARSGSTLLRAILDSHSQFYAPPELPLKHMAVTAKTRWIETSLKELQLTTEDLEHMLWDRVLADALARSGKSTIVVKTPVNVMIWQRIAECWPDARFVFLLRHPAASISSLHASWRPQWHPGESGSYEESATKGLRYMETLEEARHTLPGYTIRYEELTAEPEKSISGLCAFLGVQFEATMLDYGQFSTHRFAPGLGDASAKIRSGHIQPAAPLPRAADVPAELRDICVAWGYLKPGDDGAGEPLGAQQQPGKGADLATLAVPPSAEE